MEQEHANSLIKPVRVPWNKGKLVGAKPPLRPSHVWSIRTKLQIEGKKRDLALFNLAIDSKLRGCDVVAVRVDDVAPSGQAAICVRRRVEWQLDILDRRLRSSVGTRRCCRERRLVSSIIDGFDGNRSPHVDAFV
jgi:hypothetical protein